MTAKNKIYIFLAALVVFFGLLIFLVILPMAKGIAKNAADYMIAKEETASLDTEIKNSGTLKEQYQAELPDLEKIESLFIDFEIPIDFIRFLEKLATDSKVVTTISPSENLRKEPGEWSSLSFHLSVEGSFLNFSRFLEKLENAPYLIEVQNLDMQPIVTDAKNLDKKVLGEFMIKVFAK
jgi:hypothetical protein